MKNPNGKSGQYDWMTPDFYPQAYNRFNRLRWGIDPFKGKYYFSNLDPNEFRLSDDEASQIPLAPFTAVHLELSIESLVGQINHFNSDIFALEAWQNILREYRMIQRLHLISEFVEPLFNSCMFAPYALRNQIIFTGTKIAILLEKGRLQQKIPDDRSKKYSKHFEQWAGHWDSFKRLEQMLQKLSDGKFNQRTNEFRHRYTHRIPPRIVCGLSPNFKFERDGSRLKVYLSPEKPLRLRQCISASVVQHRMCVKVINFFWKMVKSRLQT